MLIQTLKNEFGTKKVYCAVLVFTEYDCFRCNDFFIMKDFIFTGNYKIKTDFNKNSELYVEILYSYEKDVIEEREPITNLEWFVKEIFGKKFYNSSKVIEAVSEYISEYKFVFQEEVSCKEYYFNCENINEN